MVPAGECGTCRQAQAVRSASGGVFFLCLRSKSDPGYPKYPPLPRRQCPGYDPAPAADEAGATPSSVPRAVVVREASPADAPAILGFIEQLADYEHLRHEVLATEAAAGMLGADFYSDFQAQSVRIKRELLTFLLQCQADGVTVAATGAGAGLGLGEGGGGGGAPPCNTPSMYTSPV